MDVKGAQALRERLAMTALAEGARRVEAPESADAVASDVEGDPANGRAGGRGDLSERELIPAA